MAAPSSVVVPILMPTRAEMLRHHADSAEIKARGKRAEARALAREAAELRALADRLDATENGDQP